MVDPLAMDYAYKSTYDYAESEPTGGIDLDGLERVSAWDAIEIKRSYTDQFGYDLYDVVDTYSPTKGIQTIRKNSDGTESFWRKSEGQEGSQYYSGEWRDTGTWAGVFQNYTTPEKARAQMYSSFVDDFAMASAVGIGGTLGSGALMSPVVFNGLSSVIHYAVETAKWALNPRVGINYSGAIADFVVQLNTNNYDIKKINEFSVIGNLFLKNPLYSGAITTMSGAKEERNWKNFLINSAGNALGNGPGLMFEAFSKIGTKGFARGALIGVYNFTGNIVSRGAAQAKIESNSTENANN